MSRSASFISSFTATQEDPFGLRPLDTIATTGGVLQARIARVLGDLLASLTALHQRHGVHGAISTHTIGLDETGTARLLAPRAEANAEQAQRAPGFAAFEQYSDDPGLSCGPWTDAYGLSAVAFALIKGSPPPDALSRRVRDDYVPLATHGPAGYDEAFLRAIDAGLALAPEARPRTMAEFAASLGLAPAAPRAPAPAAVPAVARAAAPKAPPAAGAPSQPPRASRASGRLIVPVVVIAALAAYFFLNQHRAPDASTAGSTSASTASTNLAPAKSAAPVEAAPAVAADTAAPAPTPAPTSAASTPASAPAAATVAESAPPAPVEPVAPVQVQAAPIAPVAAPSAPAAPATPAKPLVASAAAHASTPPAPKGAPVDVKIDIRPWGEVVVDGTSRGVSPPLRTLSLPPGQHTVVVRNADLPAYKTTLDIKPGQPASISHGFQ